jgi:serine/threonine protein kinase/WD40 repeat protein
VVPEAPTEGMAGGLLSPGQVLGDRYQIRELLGSGGMGEVWQAFDLKLRVEVALKALREDLFKDERRRELLRQEVRAAREVVSPNVCRIFDLIEVDGSELVSMEYVDGETLLQVLQVRGPLDLKEAQDIASQFLAGLEAIHRAGLVHRDVKPENIMLTRAGRVVVMDFGLARGEDSGAGTVAGTPAYMAPEQAAGMKVDARADVYSAGVVLAEMVSPDGIKSLESRQSLWEGIRQEPAKVPESPWKPVLRRAVAKEPDQRYNSAHTLTRALEDVTLRVEGAEDLTPYPGLASFTEDDAEYFFGREAEVERMWRRLDRPHLLGIVGPSGSGKSSFIRAGLIPSSGADWAIVHCTPGDTASASLRRALASEIGSDPQAMGELAAGDADATVSAYSRWRARHGQALLIVDQFEELFTLSPGDEQAEVAELLSRLALEADVFVLLSMRDDFLMACRDHEPLAPVFEDLTVLPSLSGGELRRAVVQPAATCGYRFEDDELVEEMLGEVEGERGALPMLAFALARLWEKRDRDNGLLTRQAFHGIGGVGGALARHAEATIDRIGSDRVPIVRELFRNLITAEGTRAVREWHELLSVFNESLRTAAEEVLRELIDARLLTSYEVRGEAEEPTRRVEIIHESLIENWPRLVGWRTQDADSARLRDELRQAARTWEEHDRSDDLLWTGSAFREFAVWRERYPGGLTEIEEAFAHAMTSLATRRRRRRRAVAATVMIFLAVVATVLGTLWRRSVQETRRAEAAKLLALGQAQLDTDPTEALAYTTASLGLADTDEARLFALRLLWEAPPALVQLSGAKDIRSTVFSPDGSHLALGSIFEEVVVHEEEGGPALILPGHESQTNFFNIAQWASNELLVTGSQANGLARIWSLPGGELVREIDVGDSSYFFSHANNHLYAEVPDTDAETGAKLWHLRSWELPDGEALELGTVDRTALGDDFGFSWFTFDARGWYYGKGRAIYVRPLPIDTAVPDRVIGRHENAVQWAGEFPGEFPDPLDRLWTRDAVTGELRLWNLSEPTGKALRVIGRPAELEDGVDFRPLDPDGRWVHSVTRELRLWDSEAWPQARPLRLRRSGSWYAAGAAIHPRSDWVVAATQASEQLSFWPLKRPLPRVVDGYLQTEGRPVAFSPDGKWLATTWSEGSEEFRLWPLPGNDRREPRVLSSPGNQVWYRLVFDPKMRFIFSVGGPWDAIGINPLDGSTPDLKRLSDSNNTVMVAAAVSPSGRLLATAPGRNGPWTLRVWDIESGELRLFDLPESTSTSTGGRARAINSMAFTDESTLYTSGDGGIRRWDLESGSHELVLPTPPDYATRMRIAADGRTALVASLQLEHSPHYRSGTLTLLDLASGETRELPAFGREFREFASDASGTVVATDSSEGIIRVGRVDGEAPHLLLGHEGAVDYVEISPDGRWVASSGEDNTLRLWPMPDLDKPPLQTLPHDELIAKLKTLTNLRAVRDETSATGWTIEVGPFPGWKTVPDW